VFVADENQQPLSFSHEVEAAEVAEVKADDLQEISYAAAHVGESSQPVFVELTPKYHAEWTEDLEANAPVLTIAVITALEAACGKLYGNPKAAEAISAFRIAFSELVIRLNCSKPSVVLYQRSGTQRKFIPAPSLSDFSCDLFLCARRVLSKASYEVLCRCVDEDFQRWALVPEHLRREIARKTGRKLLQRGIVSHGKTRDYWCSRPRWVAPRLAPEAFRSAP
jgi:hypothetical protein